MIARVSRILSRVANADIVRVFSLTAVSTLVKMLAGFVSIKVIAVILGPDGLALIGQLNNFSTIIMAVASVGTNNGITKYVAEYKANPSAFKNFVSTAYRITIVGSVVSGLFMICFPGWLGRVLFKTTVYDYVFVIFGITIIFYAVNNLLLSVVNGLKQFKRFVWISIANSVGGLIYTILFVWSLGLRGALISFVTYQSVSLLITAFMLRRSEWFRWNNFRERFSAPVARKYMQYTLMTLVSISVVPVSQLILRGYVMTHISELQAGWWEAMNRLSNMYLIVITSSFGIYYLPRLSELQTRTELRREILKAYGVIIPALVAGFISIYLCRMTVIRILFTPEFYPMEQLFAWQLSGDLFKIGSWLLAFLMLAKSRTLAFISTEIIFSGIYVGLGLFLIHLNGIVGLVQSYLVNYILYMGCMVVLFRKILFVRER